MSHPMKKEEANNTSTKIKEFYETLQYSSLSDVDKKNIGSIVEYFQNKQDKKYASRIFFFWGDPGIGKTYLAKKLLEAIDVEILYMACADFSFQQGIRCTSLDGLIRKMMNNKKQIIFLDDLSYLVEKNERERVSSQDRRLFMRILDLCKTNIHKIVLITTNDYENIDMRMFDRIEVKIEFDLPNECNKQKFLAHYFKNDLSYQLRKYIADNTIGYNYRDLTELVKLAYRLGKNCISKNSIKESVQKYQSTQLGPYDVQNCVEINLKDIIGKEPIRKIVEHVIHKYKNKTLSDQLDIRRSNLLLFHGPPGTGKTFMAKAIAGDLGFPLITIHGKDLCSHNSFYSLETITEMGKRYRNCVIFIDEAEKLLGNGRYGEDNALLGEFHGCIDGADGKEIQSIFILAINDICRFGETLLDRFVCVKFELPTHDERKMFFQGKIDRVHGHMKLGFTCEELALKTGMMSYREMDRVWNDLMFVHMEDSRGDSEELLSQVMQQRLDHSYGGMMFG